MFERGLAAGVLKESTADRVDAAEMGQWSQAEMSDE
jgi:hypothetical protein